MTSGASRLALRVYVRSSIHPRYACLSTLLPHTIVVTCRPEKRAGVFEDRGDAECGRWFDDQAGVVEQHSHSGDD